MSVMARSKHMKPGDLVRAKRNQGVTLWGQYEKYIAGNGEVRVHMIGEALHSDMKKLSLGLVISVHTDHETPIDTNVVFIFIPEERLFCYTWSSYLMVIQ